ncbi:MAG TPA: hypothetical protein PKD53_12355 [Chloroflexaceae bacterium]|nr:hypothetical protein [Chloroflexaceae bacterium]
MRHVFLLLGLLVGLAALAACAPTQAAMPTPRPAPTIAPFFSGERPAAPTVTIPTPAAGMRPSSDAPPLSDASILQEAAQRDRSDRVVAEVRIFDEQLDPNWTLEESWGMRLDPRSPSFAGRGLSSLEATPLEAFGGVLLSNGPDSTRLYPRSDVLGVRFSVSGGPRYLPADALVVKVVGSNRYPYFVFGDSSVTLAYDPTNRNVFPEVGLNRLGLRRDLEPGEWADVELWLDGYDIADYTYVTGLNVMNAASYMDRFYIDNVRLLVRRP